MKRKHLADMALLRSITAICILVLLTACAYHQKEEITCPPPPSRPSMIYHDNRHEVAKKAIKREAKKENIKDLAKAQDHLNNLQKKLSPPAPP
jgi:outer membrane lipopolysaccharide assembly protein LptE/RlpB